MLHESSLFNAPVSRESFLVLYIPSMMHSVTLMEGGIKLTGYVQSIEEVVDQVSLAFFRLDGVGTRILKRTWQTVPIDASSLGPHSCIA